MGKWLNYTRRTYNGEECDVLKGVAKRVIVVKSPDPKVFEEAIFIVREDYMKQAGVSKGQLLRQARQAAGCYTGSVSCGGKLPTGLIIALSALLGSGAATAVMMLIA